MVGKLFNNTPMMELEKYVLSNKIPNKKPEVAPSKETKSK
jgi:hypothetical protein